MPVGLALIALGFHRWLPSGRLPVSSDMTMIYAPFYSLRWDHGPPLWNPHVAGGTPMDGNFQFSLAYPLRWPFFFLDDWRSYFSLFLFLHYLIALFGAVGALRACGLRRGSAALGAIVFACGGYMIGRIINTTIFLASCWFPWLIWGAVGRGRAAGPISALAIAAIIWIGSPHLMIYGTVGYAVAWGFAGGAFVEPNDLPGESGPARRTPWRHGLYFALGVAAGAVALIPGLAQVRESVRVETTIENNLADSLTWGELPFSLLGGAGGFITPEINDKCLYVGGAAWTLILLAAAQGRAWRDRRWWLGVALTAVGLGLALGRAVGWQFLMPYVPALRLLEGPSRALVISAFGLGLMTAVGLESLMTLPTSRRRVVGAGLLLTGVTALSVIAAALRTAGLLGDALRGWLLVPGSVFGWVRGPVGLALPIFPLLDGGLTLIPAVGLALAWPGSGRGLGPALAALVVLELLHFAPRVGPRTVSGDFFELSATTRWLTLRSGEAPFRIAGFDPLQHHDTEWDGLHKLKFLTPNLATLPGLEDARAFDPLTSRAYRDLLARTAGQAPFNDPIRNFDLGRPDEDLFRLLNVRYLIGDPYSRRLTHFPQIVGPGSGLVRVEAWEAAAEERAVTAWAIVSYVDTDRPLRPGEEVARLIIEAEEGVFRFPIRYGRETAHLLDSPERAAELGVTAAMRWSRFGGPAERGFRLSQTNYRARIEFPRPLRVRAAAWEPGRQGAHLVLAAQAYSVAPSEGPPAWRRVFDDPVAPIFEFMEARPRVALLPGREATGSLDLTVADWTELPGIKRVGYTSPAWLTVETESEAGGLLVVRSAWAPGWQARVKGKPAPVRRVDGFLQGVVIPGGEVLVELRYAPGRFKAGWALSLLALFALGALQIAEGRRRKGRS